MSISHWPAPSPGDILWCRFPEFQSIAPGPKPRPVLVLSVYDHREPPRLRVAYGTSRHLHALVRSEVLIDPADRDAFALSGLSVPTKFQLHKITLLDYSEQWFAVVPGTPARLHPRLGTLHASLVPAVARAYDAARRLAARRSR